MQCNECIEWMTSQSLYFLQISFFFPRLSNRHFIPVFGRGLRILFQTHTKEMSVEDRSGRTGHMKAMDMSAHTLITRKIRQGKCKNGAHSPALSLLLMKYVCLGSMDQETRGRGQSRASHITLAFSGLKAGSTAQSQACSQFK